MSYTHQKFQEELNSLKVLYEKMHAEWKNPGEDYENLYKIRVNLYVTAALARLYKNNFTLNIIREVRTSENPRNLIYSSSELEAMDDKTFVNKVKEQKGLKDICHYLIHEEGSKFCDNFSKTSKRFRIYYCVSTDKKEEIIFDIEEFIVKLEELASGSMMERI